ncbi:MAG: DUF6049 family protein [Acidimicrobiia bacterium]
MLGAAVLTGLGVSVLAGLGAPARGAVAAPQHVLTLVSQPAWVPLGGDSSLHVDLASDASNAVVEVSIHRALATRIGFDRTLAGQSPGPVIQRLTPTLITDLATDGDGNRIVPLLLQDPAAPRDPKRLQIRQTGVYPVEVEARDRSSGASIDGFLTYLVAIRTPSVSSPTIPNPLLVAWAWHITTRPAYLVDNQPDPEVIAEMQPNGRLGRIAAALPQTRRVPISLVPGPETIESWKALAPSKPAIADGLRAIESAATNGRNQIVAGPYVSIDIPALDAHGLGDEVGSQLALGDDALNAALGLRVDPRTAVVERVDDGALARLRQGGVDRLVLEPESLAPVPSTFTPARPFDLESGGRTFRAAAEDAGLSQTLDTGDVPALQAQRLLAGLSLVALERPGEARGLVLSNPADWHPSTEAIDAVLSGLEGHPLLDPVSLDTYFGTLPVATEKNGQPQVRRLAPSEPGTPPVTEAAFNDSRRRLDAFRSMVGGNDPRIANGERALQVSLSSTWTGTAGRARANAELFVIDSAVQEFASKIRVPDGRTITLTSRTARLPLSFTNDTGQAVRVLVRLSSNKLFFPDGSVQEVLLPPKTRTVEFRVRARTSGAFPVLVRVSSTDGKLVVQNARMTVRSAVFSGVGIFLTIAAMTFLLIWWFVHLRRERRAGGRRARRSTTTPAGSSA